MRDAAVNCRLPPSSRVMQLLLKTTSFRHVVGAKQPRQRAGLERRHNNSLDDGVAKVRSYRCSAPSRARNNMGPISDALSAGGFLVVRPTTASGLRPVTSVAD